MPDHHDDLFALLPGLQPGPFDGRLARSLARDARIARTFRQRPPRRVARLRSVRLAGRLLRARHEREKEKAQQKQRRFGVRPAHVGTSLARDVLSIHAGRW